MTDGTAAASAALSEPAGLQQRQAALSSLATRYVTGRLRRHELNGATAAGYRSILWSFGRAVHDRHPSTVTRRDVQRWMEQQANTAATVRKNRSVVIGFFDWCVIEGHAKKNPARGLGKIKVPHPLPRAVQHDAVTATLEHAPDERARLVVSLMVQEALRAKEVAGLEVGDVDLRRRSVLVQHGKGDKQRIVPLSDETAEALAGYLAAHPATAGPLIRSYSDPHRPLRAGYVSRLVSSWMHHAGVAETGHALRHTAASDLLEGGMHIRNVQYFLGHDSIKTTERYLRLMVGDLRDDMPTRRYRRPTIEGQAS